MAPVWSCALVAALQFVGSDALKAAATQRSGLQAPTSIPSFTAFLESFGRTYKVDSEEYTMRQAIYEERAAQAEKQNSFAGRTWNAGVSYLWDWTEQEFAQLRGWVRSTPQGPGLVQVGNSSGNVSIADLPAEKLWGNLTSLNTVFDQGGCGSCWAIAGARVLQANVEIHTGEQMHFSAQQLVSCVPNPQQCGGQGGCRGATVELAYAWVMKHGLAQAHEVPYTAQDSTCSVPATTPGVALKGSAKSPSSKISGAAAFGMVGWARLPENEYAPLMRAVVERGPVAVSASARWWGLYSEGVFTGCPQDAIIDHAVTLIGYGHDELLNMKFWKIQNSWGPHWGEHGIIRLQRHDGERQYCGIDTKPEQGTACLGGPPNVTVCGMCGVLYDSVVPHF